MKEPKRQQILYFLTPFFLPVLLERRIRPVWGFAGVYLHLHHHHHREVRRPPPPGRMVAGAGLWALTPDSERLPSNSTHETEWYAFEALESYMMYEEGRPRRLQAPTNVQDHHHHYQPPQQHRIVQHSRQNDWGVDHHIPPPVEFPDTIDSLTDAALDAIAGTLYDKTCLDPNIVQNALQGDYTHGRRPVRSDWDVGRMGIEIDGAQYLFSSARRESCSAIRRVALHLAAKLSRAPWSGYEENIDKDGRFGKQAGTSTLCSGRRPIVLYFNQIKQALAASYELLLLKKQAMVEGDDSLAYSNITIMILNEDATIPTELFHSGNMQTTKKNNPLKRSVDPSRGLLLVVQPTDYNSEYRPPGPAVGSVSAFQKLAARASVEQIPVVCLSPRFLAHPSAASYYAFEQSGYQQASSYGGAEPPVGPTPWILRDFSPPVFCWIANAMTLRNGRTRRTPDAPSRRDFCDEMTGDDCWYRRLSLYQSVMHKGHAWHLFASKECSCKKRRSMSVGARQTSVDYHYLASTRSASGRPTRDVMERLFGEFAPYT